MNKIYELMQCFSKHQNASTSEIRSFSVFHVKCKTIEINRLLLGIPTRVLITNVKSTDL